MRAMLCCLVVVVVAPLALSEAVLVSTTTGAVRGVRVTGRSGGRVDTFFGLPFAKPPVGPLRFSAPQPAEAWTGTRDATRFSSICPQLSYGGVPLGLPASEDCLYLNVYSPKPAAAAALSPVMVWIHGGGYQTGSGAYYNGTELASKGVVVVTVNYRLDALGFLSTLDDASPGNNGLLDQILALKWVKANIARFHGNPNDVTLFGESAGAACVSLLRLSPLAQGLFHRAIMESGSSLSPWALARPDVDATSPRDHAQSLALALGCSAAARQSNAALVRCLRNVTVDKMLPAFDALYKAANRPAFRPTVERVAGVIPEDPVTLLKGGAGSDVTTIRGVNRDENTFKFLQTPLSQFTLTAVRQMVTDYAQELSPGGQHVAEVTNRLMAQYVTAQRRTTPEQLRDAISEILTDSGFIIPTILESELSATGPGRAKQYLYEFTYRAALSTVPAWAGVMHASELVFVFGQPFNQDMFFAANFPFNYTAQDEQVSTNTMTLWTNFAKLGTPTPQTVGGATWPAFSLDSQNYLDIGSSLSAGVQLATSRVHFWKSLYSLVNSVLIG